MSGVSKTPPRCPCPDVEAYEAEIREADPTTVNVISKTEGIDMKHENIATLGEDPTLSTKKTPQKGKLCTHPDGCDQPHLAKGLCSKHYYQMKNGVKNPRKTNPKLQTPLPEINSSSVKSWVNTREKIKPLAGTVVDVCASSLINDSEWESLQKIANLELRDPISQAAYFIKKGIHDFFINKEGAYER